MTIKKSTKKLKGITASLGMTFGLVVHVKSIEDIKRVTEESLIVTNKITAEYSEAFMKCKGVIACTGGVMCHASILCREFQKPCIVGVEKAFEKIKEAVFIELNADKCEVRFL